VARSKEQSATTTAASSNDPAVSKKGGRYHHGDLRRALVESASDLLKEKGPAGVTLREAARRAGVTHAAPYRHFADKEALLAELAADGFVRLRAEIEEAMGGVAPDLLLETLGVVYVRFARKNPSQFRVMFGAEIGDKRRYAELMRADQAVFDLCVGAIRTMQESGHMTPGNPARMGLVHWSMLHGVAALVVDGQMERAGVRDEQIDEFARRVARTGALGLMHWPRTT
jgi:AcrR family transcriptional regulator